MRLVTAANADSAFLWNAAEAAEKREDAQVAREIVLALLANAELTTELPRSTLSLRVLRCSSTSTRGRLIAPG
jgi:hypothetical protein